MSNRTETYAKAEIGGKYLSKINYIFATKLYENIFHGITALPAIKRYAFKNLVRLQQDFQPLERTS